ncbi:MAG: mechanosensitive ion channel [Dehalococcoidia bacterium]|nr:mechanosensitive ion channel [Dehalococcoidia bacterium]
MQQTSDTQTSTVNAPAVISLTRHTIRKWVVTIASVAVLVSGFPLIAVYRELAIFVSVIAIGMALALQKFIACYFAYFVIHHTSVFHVGDRVRIGVVKGDVMHIGIFHFVLKEVGETKGWGRSTPVASFMCLT